jgi:mRNA interferase MazF
MIQRGDIVLVNFPFSSGAGSKLRPAVVVQIDRNNQRLTNTIVAMITRTTHRATREPTQLLIDITTSDGQQTGLVATSAIACENLITIEQALITRTIGRLSASLMAKVDACLKVSLELQ